MGWRRQIVCYRGDESSVSDGPPYFKEADVLENLAILPVWKTGKFTDEGFDMLIFEGPPLLPDAWAILHIPTQVIFAFALTETNAREFCKQATAELGDYWDFCYRSHSPRYPNRHDKEGTRRKVFEFTDRLAGEGVIFGV